MTAATHLTPWQTLKASIVRRLPTGAIVAEISLLNDDDTIARLKARHDQELRNAGYTLETP